MITLSGHWLLVVTVLPGACLGIGVLIGRRIWGPRWFDTSAGIDRKFRKMKDRP